MLAILYLFAARSFGSFIDEPMAAFLGLILFAFMDWILYVHLFFELIM
jgi:hypothetical protein